MAKKIFIYINIINNGVYMRIIFELNNSTSFNAKHKNILTTKTATSIAAITTCGLSALNVMSKKNTDDKLSTREALIESKLQESFKKRKTISVKTIAKELNIPLHLVITSLYRTKSNLRSLFDKVKNTSYLRKPSSNVNKEAALNIISSSKNYLTTSSSKTNDTYAEILGKKLDSLRLSQEEIDSLTDLYKLKPALADYILFSRSKSNKAGLISSNTVKSIIAAHEINQELTEELITDKTDLSAKYALRDVYKIVKINQMSEKLLEPAKNNATLVYKLATARMKNGKPRFGADDILQIVKSIKENPKITKYLIKQKNGILDYRFNGHQIRQLLITYEKFPNIVKYLINARYSISSKQPENKYTSFCIEKILDTLNGDDIDKIKMVKKLLDNNSKVSSSMILNEIEKYEECKN